MECFLFSSFFHKVSRACEFLCHDFSLEIGNEQLPFRGLFVPETVSGLRVPGVCCMRVSLRRDVVFLTQYHVRYPATHLVRDVLVLL